MRPWLCRVDFVFRTEIVCHYYDTKSKTQMNVHLYGDLFIDEAPFHGEAIVNHKHVVFPGST